MLHGGTPAVADFYRSEHLQSIARKDFMRGRQIRGLNQRHTIRFTKEQEERVQAAAKEAGLPIAEYIRTRAIEDAVVTTQTKLLLGELGTARRLMLGLFKLTLDGQPLSEPLIRELVERTEATSEAWLEKRLLQIRRRVQ
jgi:hypothetical protein